MGGSRARGASRRVNNLRWFNHGSEFDNIRFTRDLSGYKIAWVHLWGFCIARNHWGAFNAGVHFAGRVRVGFCSTRVLSVTSGLGRFTGSVGRIRVAQWWSWPRARSWGYPWALGWRCSSWEVGLVSHELVKESSVAEQICEGPIVRGAWPHASS